MTADPSRRFTNRVADYVRTRPGYPAAAMDCLRDEFGLAAGQFVADIGSGTGISAGPFIDALCTVYAVEPNAAMRSAAEEHYAGVPQFISLAGTAEQTTLPGGSVDWVLAAQAFHWFDVRACKPEFARILRPGGRIVLMWNDRLDDTPFMQGYDSLVRRHALDYESVCHANTQTDGRLAELFAPSAPELRRFPNHQDFDYHGLEGRLLSSSYMPSADHPAAPAMLADLQALFAQHAAAGTVRFNYETQLFVGPPRESRP